jgi:hypothetical protein
MPLPLSSAHPDRLPQEPNPVTRWDELISPGFLRLGDSKNGAKEVHLARQNGSLQSDLGNYSRDL